MTTREGLGELIMQRPISEYQAMSPAQILDDPDAPETLKIRARDKLEREAQEKTDAALREKEYMERLARYAYEREAQEGTDVDRQRTNW